MVLRTKSNVIVLLIISTLTYASITGVTYMDHFDFEQRYKNLHECDPFYWHPLHLPEECTEMFGNLIRSKIQAPYRVVKERELPVWLTHNTIYADFSPYASASDRASAFDSRNSYETYISRYTVPVNADFLKMFQSKPRTPMDKLFDLMRKDVKDNPTAPKITSIPYFGGVALYRQPVSYKTEAMIKSLSQAYAKVGQY